VTGARLALAAFEHGRLRLLWDRGGVPPEPPADPEWLEALEGARGFAAAEARLAEGDLDGAREAYLALGPSAMDHPFAAARMMGLLSADERFHDEALDLCDAWLARRPGFPAALSCQARIRAARGDTARASELWAELAAGAARRGEELSAIAAADACLELGPAGKATAAARAIEVALSLRRDHLPALRALLALGERGGDRETLLRACRRLAAYSTDDAEKAAAHATLGRLLLRVDPPSARTSTTPCASPRASPRPPRPWPAPARRPASRCGP
jgi:tetratricopeptide (TPR) repeat protein